MNLSYIINPDGSPVATRQIQGDLVRVPFREGFCYIESTSSTASFQSTGMVENEDGSMSAIYVSVPEGLSKGVRIRLPFYGRAFGVRFKRTDNMPNMSVVIDGVAFPVSGEHAYLRLDGASSVVDGECGVIVADDLNDGLHYAEIVVVSKTSGASTTTLYGYLAERRAGYSEKIRAKTVMNAVAVTTSAVAINTGSSSLKLRYVSKIIFTNTTEAPITVTITKDVQVWKKAIPANDTVELDLGGATISTAFTVIGSAVGVNYTVIGGV